ncbi:hypothetical protein B0H14DRAFT_3740192 [Mycena olivaceomarginata]|nr:hypothetical protein B0H14DRAFT_3740192 [Mycena olivaceomarginata]
MSNITLAFPAISFAPTFALDRCHGRPDPPLSATSSRKSQELDSDAAEQLRTDGPCPCPGKIPYSSFLNHPCRLHPRRTADPIAPTVLAAYREEELAALPPSRHRLSLLCGGINPEASGAPSTRCTVDPVSVFDTGGGCTFGAGADHGSRTLNDLIHTGARRWTAGNNDDDVGRRTCGGVQRTSMKKKDERVKTPSLRRRGADLHGIVLDLYILESIPQTPHGTSSMVAAWMPFHESHRYGALAALACAALTDLSDRLSDLNRFIVLPLCGCSLLRLRPQRHIRIRDAYWMRARRTLTCLAKCLMWPSPTLPTPSRLRWSASVSPSRTIRTFRHAACAPGATPLRLSPLSDWYAILTVLVFAALTRPSMCVLDEGCVGLVSVASIYIRLGSRYCLSCSFFRSPSPPLVLLPRRELLPLGELVYPPRADIPVLSTARTIVFPWAFLSGPTLLPPCHLPPVIHGHILQRVLPVLPPLPLFPFRPKRLIIVHLVLKLDTDPTCIIATTNTTISHLSPCIVRSSFKLLSPLFLHRCALLLSGRLVCLFSLCFILVLARTKLSQQRTPGFPPRTRYTFHPHHLQAPQISAIIDIASGLS